MKNKFKAGFLAAALSATTLVTSSAAFAAPAINEVPDLKIVINSNQITLSDVPIIVNGRTLLPIRALSNNLGVPNDDQHIIWNGKDSSVTIVKDSKKIFLKVGSTSAKLNNLATSLDCAPVNYKSRVYIPVRFVSQSFDLQVDWNGTTKTVSIAGKGGTNPGKTDPGTTTPDAGNAGLISPTSASFDKKTPADVSLTLASNTSITSISSPSNTLAAGTDYSVNGSTLLIKSAFLSTLSVGDSTLTIKYGSGKTDALTVSVKDSTSTNTNTTTVGLSAVVDSVTAKKGSTVVIPVRLKSVPSGGLMSADFNFSYDPNLIHIDDITAGELVTDPDNFNPNLTPEDDKKTPKTTFAIVYMDETLGTKLLTKDGIIANIKCTINPAASGSTTIKFNSVTMADKDVNVCKATYADGVITIN